MSTDIHEIRIKAARLLSSLGCEYAEIRISKSISTSIVLSGDGIDAVSSGDSVGGSARVLMHGSWGFVSFNDLGGLESYVKKAAEIAAAVNPAEKSSVARGKPLKGNFSTPARRDHRQVSFDEKFQCLKSYNDILKSSKKIQTTRADYRDLFSTYCYCNTEGSDLLYDKSFTGISLSSIAREGSVIQPFHETVAGYGGFEIVQGREEMAGFVAKTAVDLLEAESLSGGKYAVIADPKLAGVFIHEAFGHLSEADFVYENRRMREMMVLGREFGPPGLNVIDNGTMAEFTGYIPFDDEGTCPGETYLIRNGTLSGRLHSRETAMKMDERPTGNARAISVFAQPIVRMTNTYIDNGPHRTEDLFEAAGDGVYAIGMIGGETNLEMFTFTCGYGYEIRNGKKGKMYKDIVLSGNVFTTLKNIAMIGNDRTMAGGLGGCGKGGQSPLPVSFGGPHILIRDVLIGGAR